MDVYDRTHRNVEERESMYENEIAQITAKNSNEEIYSGLLELAGKITQQKGRIEGKKKLYYISADQSWNLRSGGRKFESTWKIHG